MIDTADVLQMIDHWLSTPVGHYFGSSYGVDWSFMTLHAMTQSNADKFLNKMKADIPVLASLDNDQLSIVERPDPDYPFEREQVLLRLGQINIPLAPPKLNQGQTGETYRVDAN